MVVKRTSTVHRVVWWGCPLVWFIYAISLQSFDGIPNAVSITKCRVLRGIPESSPTNCSMHPRDGIYASIREIRTLLPLLFRRVLAPSYAAEFIAMVNRPLALRLMLALFVVVELIYCPCLVELDQDGEDQLHNEEAGT